MTAALRVALYALGALVLLVVVNWARHELVVGLVAAFLLIVAVALLSRGKKAGDDVRTRAEDEGEARDARSTRPRADRPRAGSVES